MNCITILEQRNQKITNRRWKISSFQWIFLKNTDKYVIELIYVCHTSTAPVPLMSLINVISFPTSMVFYTHNKLTEQIQIMT